MGEIISGKQDRTSITIEGPPGPTNITIYILVYVYIYKSQCGPYMKNWLFLFFLIVHVSPL